MLVVRPPTDGKQPEAPELTKILVPLDGSELSASVLPFALDLATSLGAELLEFAHSDGRTWKNGSNGKEY